MSNGIEGFARWYKGQRIRFGSNTYFDRTTRLKRQFLPYVDWDKSEILEKEINFNINVIAELQRRINSSENSVQKESIPATILSLKNRLEYISNQSDLYPVFVGLLGFLYGLLGAYLGKLLQLALGAFLLIVILKFIQTRFQTRREISYYKELINILEAYEKRQSSDTAQKVSYEQSR